jgi:large subunit ribosomal protein L33
MAKGQLDTVHLVSSAGTGFFYSIRRKRGKEKLNVTKYDPIAKKHVVFAEKKLSRLKRKYRPGAETPVGSEETKAA